MNEEPAKNTVAIALEYDGDAAPRLSAKGEGDIARQIIDIAEAHGVPLQENPELVRLLRRVPLGEEIPEALYLAVAEVIAFAYIVAGRFPEDFSTAAVD